jgi:hypothetical protein
MKTLNLPRENRSAFTTRSLNKIKVASLALLLGCGLAAPATAVGNDNRAPEVPAEIAVDASTNKVQLHGFGVGFQVYTWDGSTWTGPVPDATLFDSEGNIVADHFEGPSWQSNSGSLVVGTVTGRVTMDLTAIQWVRLVPVSTAGPGVFADVTFIQRINTVGGRAPATNGTFIGQTASVPYTADYFFYRASND